MRCGGPIRSTTWSRRSRRGGRWRPAPGGTGRGRWCSRRRPRRCSRRSGRAVRGLARLAGAAQPAGRASRPLHVLERRQLARARVLMPHSPGAAAALPLGAAPSVIVPPPIPAAPVAGDADAREPVAVALHARPEGQGPRAAVRGLGAGRVARRAAADRRDLQPERAHGFLARRGLGVPAGRGARRDAAAAVVPGSARPGARVRQHGGVGGLRDRAARGARSRCAARLRPGRRAVPGARDRARARPGVRGRRPRPGDGGARARGGVRGGRRRRSAAYRSAAREALAPYRREAAVARLQEDVLPALLGR